MRGQHDGDGDEGDKQVHALIGGDQSKDQGEHGDEDIEAVGEFPGHLGDGRLEGAALGNQVECAAREHQHEDQVSGVHEAVDDIVHNLQGVDWRVFDIVEALRIDQIPSGDCVLKTHIGAGRHDPGKQDRRKNDHKNNDQCMRHLKRFLFGQFFCLSHQLVPPLVLDRPQQGRMAAADLPGQVCPLRLQPGSGAGGLPACLWFSIMEDNGKVKLRHVRNDIRKTYGYARGR